MPDMNLNITQTVCAMVSTPDGRQVQCVVEMVLSPYYLMPMYKAEAIEGLPFNDRRKAIVPMHRVSFSYARTMPPGDQPHDQ